jgi:hypothetical protein
LFLADAYLAAVVAGVVGKCVAGHGFGCHGKCAIEADVTVPFELRWYMLSMPVQHIL